VRVKVVERTNTEKPVLSYIEAHDQPRRRTRKDGTLDVTLDQCTYEEEILADAISPHLCDEMKGCEIDEMLFELDECSAAQAYLAGGAFNIPYSPVVADLLRGGFLEALEFDQAAAIHDAMVSALDANAFGATSEGARDLAVLAQEADETAIALDLATLSLDAGFRAAGLEPATSDAPLLRRDEVAGAFVPTDIGWDVLAALDPEMIEPDEPTEPVILTDEAIARIYAIEERDLPLAHPAIIEDFDAYFDG
jgi:hypothetical protein